MVVSGGPTASRPRYTNMSEAAQAQAVHEVLEMLHNGHPVEEKDSDGNTSLHWAAWFKIDALLYKLLDAGAKPDACNLSNETPVHWAAKSAYLAGLDALTKGNRVILCDRDIDGFSAFILAAQHDSPGIMEWMFLKGGVSIEEQDNHGRTALHWACYKGHKRVCHYLLSRNASILHRDHEGTTCLHWAAMRGHHEIALMLLDVGAVHLIDSEDGSGDTPMELARRKGNTYIVGTFYKCKALQKIIGRPSLSKNYLANVFQGVMLAKFLIFVSIIAPSIWAWHSAFVLLWVVAMGLVGVFWYLCKIADAGWLTEQTIWPQTEFVGRDPQGGFDYVTPVESQMAYHDLMQEEICEICGDDELGRLEFQQQKLNYKRSIVAQAKRRLEDSLPERHEPFRGTIAKATTDADLLPYTDRKILDQLNAAHSWVKQREGTLSEQVGRARLERLLEQDQGGEYMHLLEKGNFKSVCVVCRCVNTMRSHHCKDCGRCVERLDHHCPWIDGDVGVGNQRQFYLFLVFLMTGIVGYWYGAFMYVFDEVVPDLQHGSAYNFFSGLFSHQTNLLPVMKSTLVIFGAFVNCGWFAFVGALIARHTALMVTNITTFETLKRPAHVQRRFPRAVGKYWWFGDITPHKAFWRCLAYWTLDASRDKKDFKEPKSRGGSEPGSAVDVEMGQMASGSSSGSGSRGGVAKPLIQQESRHQPQLPFPAHGPPSSYAPAPQAPASYHGHQQAGQQAAPWQNGWNYHLVAPGDGANNA